MKPHRHITRILRFAVLLGLLLAAAGLMAEEGYDPMKQITYQFTRPCVMLVVDTSGSMAWNMSGASVGVDSQGELEWSRYRGRRGSGGCGRRDYPFTFTLKWNEPSRMVVLKNSLGNSVGMYRFTPPSSYPPTGSGWNRISDDSDGNPRWKKCQRSSSYPSAPFDIDDVTGYEYVEPQDLIGRTSDTVNWGLLRFSGSSAYELVTISTDDNNQQSRIDAIQNYLRLRSNGGLNASGSTPTREGLRKAKYSLRDTFRDDERADCGRTYAVILVTDGESNKGNPGDDEWDNCPNYWWNYPAGRARDLWEYTVDGIDLTIRTWCIGISEGVGVCELNYTAYKGRTDASSPNGDAGFATEEDPYLPEGSPGSYNTSHGNYAYFATSSSALLDAFASIVAATASGDYATAPPSVDNTGILSGDIAFLTSAQYPSWKGHLYAYNIAAPEPWFNDDDEPIYPYKQWDAGEKLNQMSSADRKIYTWNPYNGNQLIEVNYAHVSQLDALCGGCGIDWSVVDFTRGNNGYGGPRSWRLGPIIFSTPAIVGTPTGHDQNQLEPHVNFESQYASRHALVYIASSDGMIHLIDTADGAEVLALLPPKMLAKQVEFFQNYTANPQIPTGQNKLPGDFIYGVTSSPRFLDITVPTGGNSYEYSSVLFIGAGSGGDELFAVDVTHPYPGRDDVVLPYDEDSPPNPLPMEDYPADANYDPGQPVEVLWYHDATTLAGLGDSWSTPSVAAIDYDTFMLAVGSGETADTDHPFYFMDAHDGDVRRSSDADERSGALVTNQTFADAIFYDTHADTYQIDNIGDLYVQPDLNGRLWFQEPPNGHSFVGIDLGSDQPVYYTPAAGVFYRGSSLMNVFVLATGTPYEKSEEITGTNSPFVPRVHIIIKDAGPTAAGSGDYWTMRITDVPYLDEDTGLVGTLSNVAQVTASPMLFVPSKGSSKRPFAFFSFYDPTLGCTGTSYIAAFTFDPDDPSNGSGDTTDSIGVAGEEGWFVMADEGASSGFAISGSNIISGKSGKTATVSSTETPVERGEGPTPRSWIELK